MTSDERRDAPDSLADQAAAWVPPWARPAAAPAEQPADVAYAGDAAEPDETVDPADVVDPAGVTAESVDAAEVVAPDEPVEERPEETDPVSARPDVGARVPDATATRPVASLVPAEPTSDAVGDGGPEATGAGSSEAPGLVDEELRAALEAILLVVDEPVAEIVLAEVLEQPTNRVAAMLEQVSGDYTAAGHGFDLRRAAGGWRLYTRPEYATYVERFVLNGQAVRLTQAALETLAVVAYKQPVTRSRISAIRGVNCDGVIRTLVSRGLVEECGSEPDSGAFLYRTTTMFLEKLGLNTVDELPPLAPFLPDDLEEIADAPR
ncbi:SMC-Scp complex subunit ScpB [Micromonospora sp. NPDC004704]